MLQSALQQQADIDQQEEELKKVISDLEAEFAQLNQEPDREKEDALVCGKRRRH